MDWRIDLCYEAVDVNAGSSIIDALGHGFPPVEDGRCAVERIGCRTGRCVRRVSFRQAGKYAD